MQKKITKKASVKAIKTKPRRVVKNKTEKLVETAVKAIQDKKGENIIALDLTKIENCICKYFVICHAGSNTQVKAIADHVEEKVRKTAREKVWHSEGRENAQWILMDYADVVVHVFHSKYRSFYNLEGLWADAKITSYGEE